MRIVIDRAGLAGLSLLNNAFYFTVSGTKCVFGMSPNMWHKRVDLRVKFFVDAVFYNIIFWSTTDFGCQPPIQVRKSLEVG